MTKTFKSFTKDGKWRTMGKVTAFRAKADAGIPVAVFHPNGSFFTVANAEKLPDGVPAKGRAV
jgi:hypothetical protein